MSPTSNAFFQWCKEEQKMNWRKKFILGFTFKNDNNARDLQTHLVSHGTCCNNVNNYPPVQYTLQGTQ